MWCFGHIQFSDWATDALVQFGSFFRVYGDENLEDLYLDVTFLISLAFAISIVLAAHRLRGKHKRRG
ncbi:non-ribosomal peptide synthetase [Paraburkholderia sp. Ac-20336]|nr:non-ribosomal peptide synthetase [Paraburkholderia sp. Ac-20336]MBN3847111.1 non-ribosomal peptide synthetase [Paraburkholderia sp. Ac-20342]NIF53153.1 non-ribosomal peptide synthetase [Burkholderia sp. Ax-1724]NIF76717.1 non-ribosomal peptide synthetase [Paraburkholderia sp. Cy-641]